MKGLSRMRGNSHVRFLGEGLAVMPSSYPIIIISSYSQKHLYSFHCLGHENRIMVIEYCISYQTDRGQIIKPFHWKLPQSFRLLQFAIAEYFLLSIPKHPE